MTSGPAQDDTKRREFFATAPLQAINARQKASPMDEMNYRFVKYGARIKEIPFFFLDRTRGSSKLTLRIGLEALWVAWWLRIADALGRI